MFSFTCADMNDSTPRLAHVDCRSDTTVSWQMPTVNIKLCCYERGLGASVNLCCYRQSKRKITKMAFASECVESYALHVGHK